MARQSNTPIQFNRSMRVDIDNAMSSGRAGQVIPISYIPLLRGDSASGRLTVDVELAEMPRPLLNGVMLNAQAWLVPKTAHPQFAGSDEFMNSYTGDLITTLGSADRIPPSFYNVLSGGDIATFQASDIVQGLGLHVGGFSQVNTDILDAFNMVYNFRLAAHSSRLTRREYASENLATAGAYPRAFWPSGAFSSVVPDYESALVKGAMDADVFAGVLQVDGLLRNNSGSDTVVDVNGNGSWAANTTLGSLFVDHTESNPRVTADLGSSTFGMTLADIDKARTTQAFAKLRTAYAGNDVTGFANDDAIVATLMSGLQVPEDHLKRCILLDSKRMGFGMGERYATDAANLDVSVTQGRASADLSLNVPVVDSGGMIIITIEVLPEQVYERQSDEFIGKTSPATLPNALRDIQRVEPVDMVINRRLDNAHNAPDGLYGYEPMNNEWNRMRSRMGGAFFQPDPLAEAEDQRSALWLTNPINPSFTEDHWLCPNNFPHDVFADELAPAFEYVTRHSVTISGLTQFGDALAEDNDEMVETLSHDMSDGSFIA